jgi:D-alanine-D-alanine ligase
MKICVLHPSYEGSSSPCNGLDPDAAPELWLRSEHDVEDGKLQKSTAVKQLIELSKKGYDCFLNLCDGAWDEDRAGIEVVEALEKLNLPYTGAIPSFYDPSKELMKTTALYYGVPTPGFRTCWNLEEVSEAGQELRYPLIVKHHNGK